MKRNDRRINNKKDRHISENFHQPLRALWKWWNSLHHHHYIENHFCVFVMVSIWHTWHINEKNNQQILWIKAWPRTLHFFPVSLEFSSYSNASATQSFQFRVKRKEMGKYYFGVQVHCHLFWCFFFLEFSLILNCSLSLCFSLIGWLLFVLLWELCWNTSY